MSDNRNARVLIVEDELIYFPNDNSNLRMQITALNFSVLNTFKHFISFEF